MHCVQLLAARSLRDRVWACHSRPGKTACINGLRVQHVCASATKCQKLNQTTGRLFAHFQHVLNRGVMQIGLGITDHQGFLQARTIEQCHSNLIHFELPEHYTAMHQVPYLFYLILCLFVENIGVCCLFVGRTMCLPSVCLLIILALVLQWRIRDEGKSDFYIHEGEGCMLPTDYSHTGVIRSIPHLEARLGRSTPTVRCNKLATKGEINLVYY